MSLSPAQPLAAATSVMPGDDLRRSTGLLEAEFAAPHLSTLPELPARGHHASLLGRAVAQLEELSAELTSYGWRLVPRPGGDQLRAEQLLSSDVDTLADVRGARAETGEPAGQLLSIELLGPLSFCAQLALPGGEKVLLDHGARRDLTESLAAGAAGHLEHLRRTSAPSSLSVTVLEPEFQRVRAGTVRTVSGYRTLRAVSRDEARTLLSSMVAALHAAGADEVLLDLGGSVAGEQVQDFHGSSRAQVDGFALNPALKVAAAARGSAAWEQAAELVEAGARLRVPLMRDQELSSAALPAVSVLAERISRPWTGIGMPLSALEAVTVVPLSTADRLHAAQVSEPTLMRALTRTRDAAEALADQIRG